MLLLNNYEYLKVYAITLSHDTNKASELVQDTLIKCWQMHPKCDNLPQKESIAYTKKILYNIFIDSLRKKNRDRLIFELHDSTGSVLPTPFKIENAKKAAFDNNKRIEDILKFIPTKIRRKESFYAWLLNKFLNYSYSKIAKIMKLKINNVGAKIHRVNVLVKKHFNSFKL